MKNESTKTYREIIQAMLDDGWITVPCIVSDIKETPSSMAYDFIHGFIKSNFPIRGNNGNWKYAIPFDPKTKNVIIDYIDGKAIFKHPIKVSPMTQRLKPNDLVYVPSVSNSLHRLYLKNGSIALDIDEDEYYLVNTKGQKYYHEISSWGTQPFAFLATPEMKEKLEQVYGKLEDIPANPTIEEFKEMLDIVLSEAEKGNFDREKHFNELVRMFEEKSFIDRAWI